MKRCKESLEPRGVGKVLLPLPVGSPGFGHVEKVTVPSLSSLRAQPPPRAAAAACDNVARWHLPWEGDVSRAGLAGEPQRRARRVPAAAGGTCSELEPRSAGTLLKPWDQRPVRSSPTLFYCFFFCSPRSLFPTQDFPTTPGHSSGQGVGWSLLNQDLPSSEKAFFLSVF